MPFPWSEDDEQPVGTPGHDGFCAMYLFAAIGFSISAIVGGFYFLI